MSSSSTRKLIALDLDGTLLTPDGKLSPRTAEVVHRVRDAGHFVCIATGRNRGESQPIVDQLDHDHHPHHHVFVGGAMVVDTARDEILHAQTMQPNVASGLCRLIESHELAPSALQTKAGGFARFYVGRIDMPGAVNDWYHATGADVVRLDDLPGADHATTLRVSTLGRPDLVNAVGDRIASDYGDAVFAYKVQLAHYGVELLESFHPAATKWTGVKVIADRHGIDAADVIAVGDDNNDLPMLTGAGLGVAMGNARQAAKDAADRVIGRNTEDGLAEFLEELV